ncbi:MAG TPA: hypothetical protein VJP76_07470 [Candidatus Tumulicola sp.]|nr:hypothetical protein [Candidatus Tumulicola sp.]
MDDVFYVVGVSDGQFGRASDPVRQFITAAVEHGEALVQKGLGPPDAVAIPVEIYSLSAEHKDRFAEFGAGSDYALLYFLSDSVVRMAQRLGVALPPALKEIPRSALPPERGSRVRVGEHFWDHREA